MCRPQSQDKGALVLSAVTQLHRRAWRSSSFRSVRPQNSNSWKQSGGKCDSSGVCYYAQSQNMSTLKHPKNIWTCPTSVVQKTLVKICPIKKIWLPWNYFNKWELQHIASWNSLFVSKLKQLLSPLVCITVAHLLTSLSVIHWKEMWWYNTYPTERFQCNTLWCKHTEHGAIVSQASQVFLCWRGTVKRLKTDDKAAIWRSGV